MELNFFVGFRRSFACFGFSLLSGCQTLFNPPIQLTAPEQILLEQSNAQNHEIWLEDFRSNYSSSGPNLSAYTVSPSAHTAASVAGVVVGGLVSSPRIPVQPKGEIYYVWYGTNRRLGPVSSLEIGYTNTSEGSRLNYGAIAVDIPTDFLKKRRSSDWVKALLGTSVPKLRLRAPVPLDSSSFIDTIRKQLKTADCDDQIVLVYIHGFQTSFDEAMLRGASIGYQLKVPVTAVFSWPSKGKVAAYLSDKDAAENSEDALATFLIKVQAESGARRINVIAHSMGNYALLRAMYRPMMRDAIGRGLKFDQVILAAPDVDTELFLRDASIFRGVATRVTLYASSADLALQASNALAARSRAGLTPPITTLRGIDTLDVSAVNMTFLGHSYVEAEIAVLEDMDRLIRYNAPPAKRMRVWAKDQHWELR